MMLPHVRLANKSMRIDQIANLYDQICIDNPIRIDINKISQPIESIHLGWVLAICRIGYQLFKDVDFNNPNLDSMAYKFINKINKIAVGGYDLRLISELPKNQVPDKGKIYLAKQDNQLKYVVMTSNGKTISSMLDFKTSGELTPTILNSLKLEILEETSKRGHATIGVNPKKYVGIPKYYEEYDFPTLNILNRTFSYDLPPDAIVSLLTEESFSQYTIQEIIHPTYSANQFNSDLIDEDTLNKPLIEVIKEINPNYMGSVHNKTSAPHKLIIRVIAVMIKLNTPKNEITWRTVHPFIDKHIYQYPHLNSCIDLEDVDEYQLKVGGVSMLKNRCQKQISRYKNEIFNF